MMQNPFDAGETITFPIEHGGYYRTPSLINVWATAPFFQNNYSACLRATLR